MELVAQQQYMQDLAIFYPDLIDKTKEPTYTIEKDGNGETCIIRFHAGPLYEDTRIKWLSSSTFSCGISRYSKCSNIKTSHKAVALQSSIHTKSQTSDENDGKHPTCDNTYINRREFSFTLDNDIYIRYQSFGNAIEMGKSIKEKCLVKIDIGPVYNVNLAKRTAYAQTGPVERELIFDIDMSDYDDVRYCCSGGDVCSSCWPLMTAAVKVIDTSLRKNEIEYRAIIPTGPENHQDVKSNSRTEVARAKRNEKCGIADKPWKQWRI